MQISNPPPPLSRSPARVGRLRPASRPPKAKSGSTSTRSAPGRDGIVTSRWPCWPTPIWPSCVSTPSGGEDLDLAADLLPLTVPEVRRLIWRLVWAKPPDPIRARLVGLATTTPAARQTITLDPQNQNSSTPAVVLVRLARHPFVPT